MRYESHHRLPVTFHAGPAPVAPVAGSDHAPTLAISHHPESTALERDAADLYLRLLRPLCDLARRMGCGAADAEDFVHDAFTAYWIRISTAGAGGQRNPIREPEAMLTRLLKDAVQAAVRRDVGRLRRVAIMITGPVRAVKRWMQPAQRAEDAEIRDIVRQGLEAMRPREREVFVLTHHKDLSLPEVGRWLGIEASSARKELSRAAHKLRKRLIAAGYVRPSTSSKTLNRGEIA